MIIDMIWYDWYWYDNWYDMILIWYDNDMIIDMIW